MKNAIDKKLGARWSVLLSAFLWWTVFGQVPSARGDVILSGVLESNVIDPVAPLTGILEYKAIEFFTDLPIPAAEATNYFLRRYAEFDDLMGPAATDTVFFAEADIEVGYFYAVREGVALDHMYGIAVSNGTSWAGVSTNGRPQTVIENDGILDIFDGNEAFALGYQRSNGETVILDAFGYNENVAISNQVSLSFWEYPYTYAYRMDRTGPNRSEFDEANWFYGQEDDFFFVETADVVATIPFGTYTLPEPGSMVLFVMGGCLLLGQRKRFRAET